MYSTTRLTSKGKSYRGTRTWVKVCSLIYVVYVITTGTEGYIYLYINIYILELLDFKSIRYLKRRRKRYGWRLEADNILLQIIS